MNVSQFGKDRIYGPRFCLKKVHHYWFPNNKTLQSNLIFQGAARRVLSSSLAQQLREAVHPQVEHPHGVALVRDLREEPQRRPTDDEELEVLPRLLLEELGLRADILFLKHACSILRQSSNPL